MLPFVYIRYALLKHKLHRKIPPLFGGIGELRI
jgi:hypothetical protein